jgi:phosphoglycolate phosphatase
MGAVLFDLDGTLIDSLADLGQAVNRALAELGYPGHEPAQYREYIGEGARRLVERALPEVARADEGIVEKALASYMRHYEAGWCDQTRVYPGMSELLARLQSKGTPLGVISNKPHLFTTVCVKHFFPEIPFAVVAGQKEGIARKPDPAAARIAAEGLGLETSACVYVGDSGVDMAFAKAAGMLGVGVTWGFRDREELWSAGAEKVFDDATALGEFLFQAG